MVSNRTIQIRLTKDQYERIKNFSVVKGFNSLSAYLRFAGLDQDLVMQKQIAEIHAHLIGSRIIPKFKKQAAEK